MSAQLALSIRFVRKTELAPNEYRKKFKQIDDDVIEALTSHEADKITPLMSKIYLRLLRAPSEYWERGGILRFEAEIGENGRRKAWIVLCEITGVSSATLNKALAWMHQQGIIGYFAGKNGAGIRIFLNRAVSSVGTRPASQSKKILPFPPASSGERPASSGETAFKGTSGNPDKVSDIDSSAPKNGAGTRPSDKVDSGTLPALRLEQIIQQVGVALEPSLRAAAARAASVEHERTREWLEKRGLPKVARVAQREAYDVLRNYGLLSDPRSAGGGRALPDSREVGKQTATRTAPRLLSDQEISELAESCVALLAAHGQSIDLTLSEMSVDAGGFLLQEDTPKVRARAEVLTLGCELTQPSGREGDDS